jgi:hypothetical protein
MEKYVEQYQAWGGGLTRPIWPDVQGWQEGNFAMTEVPAVVPEDASQQEEPC